MQAGVFFMMENLISILNIVYQLKFAGRTFSKDFMIPCETTNIKESQILRIFKVNLLRKIQLFIILNMIYVQKYQISGSAKFSTLFILEKIYLTYLRPHSHYYNSKRDFSLSDYYIKAQKKWGAFLVGSLDCKSLLNFNSFAFEFHNYNYFTFLTLEFCQPLSLSRKCFQTLWTPPLEKWSTEG